MSFNKRQLNIDTENANRSRADNEVRFTARSLQQAKSKMGYRDDSPFKDEPYIDVHTENGVIDMSSTGVPLWANGKILQPYSGEHKFDKKVVREIPLKNEGSVMELSDEEIEEYRKKGYMVEFLDEEEEPRVTPTSLPRDKPSRKGTLKRYLGGGEIPITDVFLRYLQEINL